MERIALGSCPRHFIIGSSVRRNESNKSIVVGYCIFLVFVSIQLGKFLGAKTEAMTNKLRPESPVRTQRMTREERQKCWQGRDAYFACLDKHGVLAPGEEGNKCSSPKKAYEKSCAQSWVRISARVLAFLHKTVQLINIWWSWFRLNILTNVGF